MLSERDQNVASDNTWAILASKTPSPQKNRLSLSLAWIGHEFYGHAIQYSYMADSVFLFGFFSLCHLGL